MNDREKRLDQVRSDASFDAIVLGGGVNGIGVYRDLALQGLRVLLIERNDFCSGCSAAPSRMIHGGLRYLENGEFDLVRESLAERDALLRNAPHLVRPLPTVVPVTTIFSGLFNSAARFLARTGKPSQRGLIAIKLGLSLYDWVTRHRRLLPPHRFFSAAETRRKWPALTPRAKASALYFDAWISYPERLCIEMVNDARAASGNSPALNYAELSCEDGAYVLACRLTGERLPVVPRVIVNATGAWLDATVKSLGGGAEGRMVSGTKGSHLILDNARLAEALDGHMVYFENADGRVCIVFPYLGHVLAGSTDIRIPEASRVRCEPEELDYILESLRHVFPGVRVGKEDVVFSYSGIRPLPESDLDFTGRISRDHEVRRLDGLVPQFCMIGGKWTTFRAFAEQTTNAVVAELGKARKLSTLDMAIGGGSAFPPDATVLAAKLTKEFGVNPDRAEHLVGHYGTAAFSIQGFCDSEGNDRPLGADTAYTECEIRFLVRNEIVETLSDIVLRRTSLAITGAVSLSLIDRIAGIMAAERQFSAAAIAEQRAQLIAELEQFYGVTLAKLEARDGEARIERA